MNASYQQYQQKQLLHEILQMIYNLIQQQISQIINSYHNKSFYLFRQQNQNRMKNYKVKQKKKFMDQQSLEEVVDNSLIIQKGQNDEAILNTSVFENYYIKEREKSKLSRFRNSCLVTMSEKQNHELSGMSNIFKNHQENQIISKHKIQKKLKENDIENIEEKNNNAKNSNKKSRFQPTSTCSKHYIQKTQQNQQKEKTNQNVKSQFVTQNQHLPLQKFEKSMILLKLLNKTQEKILDCRSNYFQKDLQFLKEGNKLTEKIKGTIDLKNKLKRQSQTLFSNDDSSVNFAKQLQRRKKLQKTSINLGNHMLQIPNVNNQDRSSNNLISSWNALQKLDITYKTKQEQLLKENYQLCTKIKQLQNKLKDLSVKNQLFNKDKSSMIFASENKTELKYQQVEKRIKKLKEEKEKLKTILNSFLQKQKEIKIKNNKVQNKENGNDCLINNLKNISKLICSKFGEDANKKLIQGCYKKILSLNQLQSHFQQFNFFV